MRMFILVNFLFVVLLYQLLGLRDRNPSVKLMIGIGGPDVESEAWRNITSYNESIDTFVYTTKVFLNELRLDGVDIAWFYPNNGGKYIVVGTITITVVSI